MSLCLAWLFIEPADQMIRKQKIKTKVTGQKSESRAC